MFRIAICDDLKEERNNLKNGAELCSHFFCFSGLSTLGHSVAILVGNGQTYESHCDNHDWHHVIEKCIRDVFECGYAQGCCDEYTTGVPRNQRGSNGTGAFQCIG